MKRGPKKRLECNTANGTPPNLTDVDIDDTNVAGQRRRKTIIIAILAYAMTITNSHCCKKMIRPTTLQIAYPNTRLMTNCFVQMLSILNGSGGGARPETTQPRKTRNIPHRAEEPVANPRIKHRCAYWQRRIPCQSGIITILQIITISISIPRNCPTTNRRSRDGKCLDDVLPTTATGQHSTDDGSSLAVVANLMD